ncbi:MAG: outer membrane beta-barrel protein, partial [Balneolaceae bacterium]
MKKLLILSIAFIFSIILFNQAKAQTAETDSDSNIEAQNIRVGVGLTFGSGIGSGNLDNDLGIRVDGYYPLTPEIRAGGDFTFYFPKSDSGVDFTVWELNFNGNYILLEEDEFTLYGLAGINITGFTVSFDDDSNSDTEIGLNLGGGAEYPLDFADLFGEIKFGGLGGDADQFVLGVG